MYIAPYKLISESDFYSSCNESMHKLYTVGGMEFTTMKHMVDGEIASTKPAFSTCTVMCYNVQEQKLIEPMKRVREHVTLLTVKSKHGVVC